MCWWLGVVWWLVEGMGGMTGVVRNGSWRTLLVSPSGLVRSVIGLPLRGRRGGGACLLLLLLPPLWPCAAALPAMAVRCLSCLALPLLPSPSLPAWPFFARPLLRRLARLPPSRPPFGEILRWGARSLSTLSLGPFASRTDPTQHPPTSPSHVDCTAPPLRRTLRRRHQPRSDAQTPRPVASPRRGKGEVDSLAPFRGPRGQARKAKLSSQIRHYIEWAKTPLTTWRRTQDESRHFNQITREAMNQFSWATGHRGPARCEPPRVSLILLMTLLLAPT